MLGLSKILYEKRTLMKCYKCKNDLKENTQFCSCCGAAQQITESLLHKAVQKDAGALEQLFFMTRESVYFTVRTMIWEENKTFDLVQEVYIRAFKSLSQLKNPAGFPRWIRHMASGAAVDLLKKEQPRLFAASEEDTDGAEKFVDDRLLEKSMDDRNKGVPEKSADGGMSEKALTPEAVESRLDLILAELPARQRLLAGLFYGQRLSTNEITEMLAISEKTVKADLCQAKEILAHSLSKAGLNEGQGLTPTGYLMWLYQCLKEYGAEYASDVMLHEILKKTAGNKGAKAAKAVGAAAVAMAGESVGEVAKEGLKATITKIIAGLTATAVIGGGTGAAVHTYNESKAEAQRTEVVQEMQAETAALTQEQQNAAADAQQDTQQEISAEQQGTAQENADIAQPGAAEQETSSAAAGDAEEHLLADFSEMDAQTMQEIEQYLNAFWQDRLAGTTGISLKDGKEDRSFPKSAISDISDLQIGTEGYFAKEVGIEGDEGNILFVPCTLTLYDVQVTGDDGSTKNVTYEDMAGVFRLTNLLMEEDGTLVFDEYVDFYGFYGTWEQLAEDWIEPLENRYRIETVDLEITE